MIRSLQHFALGVPDLKAGHDFYTAFGLEAVDRPDHLAFRCHGRDQDQLVLIETGRDRRFHHLGFGTDAAGVAALATTLERLGIGPVEPPYAGAPEGLWFHDPDGNLLNVQAVAPAPTADEPALPINTPGHWNRIGARGCPPHDLAARPRRLGHVLIFTPDLPRQTAFFCDVLGMRVSDTIQNGYAAFLRMPGDSDHHVIGLMASTGTGFHHASFEMASIDEAEVGAQRLLGHGGRHAWGPGRHGVGSNYFHYFRDPWNGLAEYFFDMDYVPGDLAWEARDWSKKDGMFLWSADGMPPADFGRNYEAA